MPSWEITGENFSKTVNTPLQLTATLQSLVARYGKFKGKNFKYDQKSGLLVYGEYHFNDTVITVTMLEPDEKDDRGVEIPQKKVDLPEMKKHPISRPVKPDPGDPRLIKRKKEREEKCRKEYEKIQEMKRKGIHPDRIPRPSPECIKKFKIYESGRRDMPPAPFVPEKPDKNILTAENLRDNKYILLPLLGIAGMVYLLAR